MNKASYSGRWVASGNAGNDTGPTDVSRQTDGEFKTTCPGWLAACSNAADNTRSRPESA